MRDRFLAPCIAVFLGWASGPLRAESYVPPTPEEVDLLLVIDSSSSMGEAQSRLATQLQALAAELGPDRWGSDGLSLHVAVITTDMGTGGFATCGAGDGGRFQAEPRGDCTGPTGAFIVDEHDSFGERTRNYEGELSDVLQCIVPVGTGGCDFGQPLSAIEAALDGTHDTNDGFLRDRAALAILVFTDTDDCSASDPALFDPAPADVSSPLGPPGTFRCFEQGVSCAQEITREAGSYTDCLPRLDSPYLANPQHYVEFLQGLKYDPNKIVFGVVAGPADPVAVEVDAEGNPALVPSCLDGAVAAEPAIRLHWVAAWFRNRWVAGSTCATSYADTFQAFGDRVRDAVFDRNLPGTDPGGGVDAGYPAGEDAGYGAVDAGYGAVDAGGGGGGSSGCGCSGARSPGHARGTALLVVLVLGYLGYLVRRRRA